MLESRSLKTLCETFVVKGSCKDPKCPPEKHAICRVQGTEPESGHVNVNQPNILSFKPRKANNFTDEVGPGYLSPNGSCHDNDHALISKIKILPTTDEVRNCPSVKT